MRRLRLLAALVLALGAAAAPPAASALDPNEMFDDPALEERARRIGRELRCVVCDNQSIFDSNALVARDLRALVRRRIEAGDNDEAVLEHVADLYGDYVLFEPPVALRTSPLWLAPIFFLGSGAVLIAARRRTQSRRRRLSADERAEARRVLETRQ